nr:hypothetical protein [Candidatus Sigynarchaeota archaeon]
MAGNENLSSTGTDSSNGNLNDGSPKASDTKITKTWQAVETLDSWWNVNWQYRKKITFVEPGLMDRDRDPMNVYVTFTGNEARVNSLRVVLFRDSTTWVEISSQVWNATTHNAGGIFYYDRCTVFFLLNMTKADTEIYYLYYDPAISTAPSYANRIDIRGRDTAMANDNVNPSFTHLNGTAYNNVDSLQVIVDGNTANPRAAVALVDTVRAGSDWGGPCNSIYSARYGNADALNLAQSTYMSVGEMALQASSAADPFDGAAERINVGPDNVAEAWDGRGAITVLDDGPLFTRVKIQTTDGAYASLANLGSGAANGWYRDYIYNTRYAQVDTASRGVTGGNGYVKYNITYTFYYYGLQTFAKIDLDIGAYPQRGPTGGVPHIDYPLEAANYLRPTNVNFKNYGDWPHLAQLVRGNAGTVAQDRKAWIGSKYGLYNMDIAARRRDYPLEPWTAWYDTATDPTVGMFSVTNSIGWEVTSLAVAGIGPNSLLQQILPEGHQGDIFTIPNNTIYYYDYYLLTSANGMNWSEVRDMCRRTNAPVSVTVSNRELFAHNGLFIHTNDLNGNMALGTRVRLSNASGIVYDEFVNNVGNVTFLRLSDGQYTTRVYFYTPNLLNEYLVRSETFTLNHLVNRSTYRNYNCNMANLSFDVVNWARSNEPLTGVLIRLRNVTTSALVEQNFTWNGFVDFRLYTTGTTQYNLEFVYGGQVRSANITNPYTLPGNRNLNVGLAIETTAITINSQSASVILGQNYQVSFYFHKSGDLATKYGAQSVTVSSQFAADYWTPTTHYVWWNAGANLIGLNLTSGPGTRLTTSGIFSVYIHAINNTMETATEKLFVVVNPIPTTIRLTMNDSSVHQIEVSKSGKVLLEVDYINAQSGLDLTTATVNYTLNSVTTSMSPYNAGNGNYTALIDTSTLDFTTYAVTIRAWQANYVVAVDAVVFIIIARPSSMALTSPGNVFFGENFTIDIDLTDGLNGSGIITSIPRFSEDVKSYPAISGTFTGVSAGHYRLTYNSRDFPGLLTFTIYVIWTAPNTYPFYQSRNTSTTVRIVQRDAVLTYDPVGNIPFRENVSVNMRYEDGINATGITPATVNTNITTYTLTNLGSGNYRFTLNSTTLSATLGTYYARITMIWNPVNRPYYENQTVIVKIVVVSRATQLVVSDPPAATEYRQNIAFSVIYSDLLSGARLSGAGRVTIASTNTSINLPVLQGDNSYRITLNSSVFAAPGVYYVPITATWIGGSPYYTNNLVSVKITVVQRSSQVTYDSLAPTPYRNNFTFYVNFLDGLNGNPISGATFSTNLTNPTHFTRTVISLGRYMISINTTEVRATTGDSYVIIYVNAPAGSPFYANGQITIRMSVTQRPTVLSYTSLQPTPYNQPVVFTMNFRDSERGTGVYQGVTVSSNGTLDSAVNLNNGFYTITIRAGTLSIGTHSVLFTFTTPAAAPFYQSNSLAISIQITARSTQIVYSGLSPTSYGGWFDFTIQVQDSLSSTALNGLSAGAFTSNSTSFAFLSEVSPGNYRINISTTELGHVGSVKYRITATPGGNYASTSSTIPFTSTNRAIALSAGSVTPTSFSVNVVFQVQYRDGITSSGLVGHASYITSSHSGSVSEIGSGIYQITVPAASFAALGSYTVTVQANWPAAISPFYANASISVPVSIIPRGAGLTVDKEANVQFGEDMTVNIAFQDAVNGSYINIPLSRIKISVIGYSNVTIINSSVGTGRYQSKISTYPLPRTGDYVVNVSTTWPGTPFYYNLSRTVTVTVSQRSTMFYPGGEIYLTRGFNVLFNVSLYYLDVINGSTITRASSVSRYVSATDYTHANIPTVNSTGTMMTYQSTVGWYATFNSSHFGNPSLYAYVVTMQFNWSKTAKPFYMNRTISFNISITAAQTQVIVLGSFVAPSGQNHTLDFQYINSESGKEIDLAIVRVNNTITGTPIRYTGITIWNGTAAWNGSHYRLVFNVTALPGSLHPFNITFSKTNYNTITYVFTLVDTALGSELTTQSIQANRILGQNISMVMVYKYQGSTNGILNAYLNVSSNVSSIYWAPSEFSYTSLGNGAYNLTIKDTGESATRIKVAGFHQVYIKMWSNTTEERVINVQFEMKQVPTNISRLYFNGTRFINPLPSYSTQITKNVNITIDFVRLFPGAQNITSGTTVFLTSSSLSSNRNLT